MSAHTPGPWTVAGESGDYFATLADYSPIPATEANARLIAAAPELLGSLMFILAFYEPGQTYLDTNAWKRAEASARAAVSKATGGEA